MTPPSVTPRRIGLVADLHDHVPNLRAALPWWRDGSDVLLVLGDLVSPFVLALLARGYERPIHVVYGNNDGDRHRMAGVASGFEHVRLHGEFARLELGGRVVVAHHFPDVAAALDPRGVDLVAFGHDHRARAWLHDGCWRVNPGTLMGYDPLRDRDVSPSWAVYDAAAHAVTFWRPGATGAERYVPDDAT